MTQRTFRDAYGVLQKHAANLRDQEDPNIDDLLTIVTESVEAYKVCKERIDAVEAALKAALDGAGVSAAPQTTAARPSSQVAGAQAPRSSPAARTSQDAPSPSSEPEDDDIPFSRSRPTSRC